MAQSTVLMTEGSIPKQIVKFAFPVFLGNTFQQLYNTVDSLIVGNYVGDEALAAVSTSGSFIFLMVGLLFGIFSGAGVVIAQYYGARDSKSVTRAIHTTVSLGVLAGLLVMFVGVVFSPQILRLINTPENVLPLSTIYFRIYFCGSLFSVLYNAGAGIFQAVGDSRHPLYYLIVSSVVNVVLDYLFVAVFDFGIAGAAVATIISQAVSCILIMYKLITAEDVYKVNIRDLRLHMDMVSSILRVGIPSGIQNAVIGFANIVVQSNINTFKDVAMAGCGSYFKLEGFAFLPVTSFSLALTTFVGQNIGANRIDRAKKGARFGILACVICAEIIGVILFIFSPQMMGWFTDKSDVIAFGVKQARTEALFYFVLSFSHAAAGVMRGAGKSFVPMVVMLLCWCVFRVSFLTIMLSIWHDIRIIFGTYPLTWTMSSIIFAIYLFSGKWLTRHQKEQI